MMNTFELLRIRRILNHDVLQSDVRSMAMEEYFGTAPIKFGPYAVKFSIKAVGTTAKTIDRPEKPDDFLREELAGRLRREDLVMDFKVQFYVDDASTPIEDTSVLWQTEPVAVARLRIPRVDLDDEPSRKLSRKVDALSFSPWHAVEDHRPLGNIMRARRSLMRRVRLCAAFGLNHQPFPFRTELPDGGRQINPSGKSSLAPSGKSRV
jgi:hypothetical protein